MKRRTFLKGMGAFVVAPKMFLKAKHIPVKKSEDGFGLMPIKSEGAIITYGNHPKALWPGIKKWYGAGYGEHPLEYRNLFI